MVAVPRTVTALQRLGVPAEIGDAGRSDVGQRDLDPTTLPGPFAPVQRREHRGRDCLPGDEVPRRQDVVDRPPSTGPVCMGIPTAEFTV